MAKAAQKGKGKGAAKNAPKGGKPVNSLAVLLGLIAMIPFSLPTLMVLFIGLLPSLVAALVERGGSRYAWLCVGGINLSGLAPWLFDLWFGHHTIDYAIHLITSVQVLLVAYGAAGIGWLIYLSVPPIVSTFTAMTSQRRSAVLISKQKKLEDLWGDGVKSGGGGGSSPMIELEL